MNIENLRSVIQAYIDNFHVINNDEHREYFKWEAFKCFKDNWNIEADDFAEMFKNSVKQASALINNSRVCPTNGIVKLAERPELKETIRSLFKDLFVDDGGNVIARQNRVENFRDKVNELLAKHEPGKFKFKQEFRTVMAYLNMYNPQDNYLYKATEAREFMYCIEFGDDFGTGQNFNLSKYYRMCDALLEEIKNTPELIESHKERMKDTMIDNDDYHILAFDIIYCAITYGLYSDIKIKRPVKNTTAKQRNDARIDVLQNELAGYLTELNQFMLERAEIGDVEAVGLKVKHKKFGEGVVVSQKSKNAVIKFEVERALSLPMTCAFGLLQCEDEEIVELFARQYELENKIEDLKRRISLVEMQLKSLGVTN